MLQVLLLQGQPTLLLTLLQQQILPLQLCYQLHVSVGLVLMADLRLPLLPLQLRKGDLNTLNLQESRLVTVLLLAQFDNGLLQCINVLLQLVNPAVLHLHLLLVTLRYSIL
jgi:hypothetical protein